ncbi:ParB-like partition protein [Desulfitobacterium dehalogenans ATCC 51507]|uniref:ParB-like partition protein n=1 Tax=Desulfitobacterium dehalogenans (strain ATCC 51507 / DSM 9161 / JW/IU-DC1) TaxID=756499 RepID=I4AEW9_DESDJ|nr:ParB/RepB/Spo0J family partition protein [Desulfitobacterium dehalogenans]AFM02504.1 ParB-like partition protein [Desulfitobacterium dehalogenans ATCC 51507]
MSKRALGRGLEALIGAEPVGNEASVQEIELNKIKANPDQPRRGFDQESLEELAASLKTHGLLQPILVQPKDDGYIIVAGERRYRAAMLAGLTKIPCLLQTGSEQELAEKALIENIQRSDLSPVEEGLAYARLIKEYGLTQEQVAERVGKGRPTVANLLRVIQLPDPVLHLIQEGKLSLGHAKVLLAIKDSSLQVLLAQKTAKENLPVRELENLILKYTEQSKTPKKDKMKDSPLFAQIEDQLRSSFQTKVKVKGSAVRGKIEIEYFSEDEFNRLLEIWNINID